MSSNIKVYCRIKPSGLNPSASRGDGNALMPACLKALSSTQIMFASQTQINTIKKCPLFVFDSVFAENSEQNEVFEQTTAPLIERLMEGFNATILAYGQTNSGKTFTLLGDKKKLTDTSQPSGIVMRSLQSIFDEVDRKATTHEFKLKVSFFEIYNEKVKDLLNNSTETIHIREKQDEIFMENLVEREVERIDQAVDLLNHSLQQRSVFATKMNDNSSRSHFVFQLVVERRDLTDMKSFQSKLFIIDLAGSEKLNRTKVEGKSLDEARCINKSLSELGNVISALSCKELRKEKAVDDLLNKTDYLNVSLNTEYSLNECLTTSRTSLLQRDASPLNDRTITEITESQKLKPHHVPYRNSKLTRLLRNSLGGNSLTSLIITVSSDVFNDSETLSSLRFGKRAKRIKNDPIVRTVMNESDYQKIIAEKDAYIAELLKKIAAYEKSVPFLDTLPNPKLSTSTLHLPQSRRLSVKGSSVEKNSIRELSSKSRDRHLDCASNNSTSRDKHTNCVGKLNKKGECDRDCRSNALKTEDRMTNFKTFELTLPSQSQSPTNISLSALTPKKQASSKSEMSKVKNISLEPIDVCEKIQDTMQHISDAIEKTLEDSVAKNDRMAVSLGLIAENGHGEELLPIQTDSSNSNPLEQSNALRKKSENSMQKKYVASTVHYRYSTLKTLFGEFEAQLKRRMSQLHMKIKILIEEVGGSKITGFKGLNLDFDEISKADNREQSSTPNQKPIQSEEYAEAKKQSHHRLINTPLPQISPSNTGAFSKQNEFCENAHAFNKKQLQRNISLNPLPSVAVLFPPGDSDLVHNQQTFIRPERFWAIVKVEYSRIPFSFAQKEIAPNFKKATVLDNNSFRTFNYLKKQLTTLKQDSLHIGQIITSFQGTFALARSKLDTLRKNRLANSELIRNLKEANEKLWEQFNSQKNKAALLEEKNVELSKSIAAMLIGQLRIDLAVKSDRQFLHTSDSGTQCDTCRSEDNSTQITSSIGLDSLPLFFAEFVKSLLEEIATLSSQIAAREQSHQKEIMRRSNSESSLWKAMHEHLTPEQVLMTNYYFEMEHLEKMLAPKTSSEDCCERIANIIELINSYSFRFANLRTAH